MGHLLDIVAPPPQHALCCKAYVPVVSCIVLPFPYVRHRFDRASVCGVCTRFQVVASDLSPSAVPIGEIDWSVPTAVVLGNEERGISDSMRNIADATFVIPMRGFVRSFNMSVACSIILAHLSAVR